MNSPGGSNLQETSRRTTSQPGCTLSVCFSGPGVGSASNVDACVPTAALSGGSREEQREQGQKLGQDPLVEPVCTAAQRAPPRGKGTPKIPARPKVMQIAFIGKEGRFFAPLAYQTSYVLLP